MYQHFVCFKFIENTSDQAVQQHLEMFAALKDAIPQIVTYAGGLTFPGGEGADQYDTAHNVVFQAKADLDIYFHHPAHLAFIEANKAHWEVVLVVDSQITQAAS
jgi:hypothetical protein